MERRATLHLERRSRVMGEDEDGRVERWVLAPPAAPLLVGPGSGLGPELAPAHDFGADRPIPTGRSQGPVEAETHPFSVRPSGLEHPRVQAHASVAEGLLQRLALAGGVAIE